MRDRGLVAAIATGAVFALLTIAAFYPPMTDLARHEALVALLRHHGDPTFAPPGLYVRDLGRANQLFYLVAWVVSYGAGVRWAVKLVVAAAQLAIVGFAARLARHAGAPSWSALLAAPVALGFLYFWGFATNLVGLAVLFGTLPELDRVATTPSPRRALGATCAIVLAWLGHESAFFVATALALLGMVLEHERGAHRRNALRAAPLAAAIVLVVVDLLRPSAPSGLVTVVKLQWMALDQKLVSTPAALVGAHDLPVRVALLAIGLASMALFARDRPRGESAPLPERLRAHRFGVLAALCLVAYLAAPFGAEGFAFLHERFLAPAWVLGAIALARGAAPRRATIALAATFPAAILLVSWPQFLDSDRAYRDLAALTSQIPLGSGVLAEAVPLADGGTRVWSASAFSGRVVAERGGRTTQMFTYTRVAPVHVAPGHWWNDIDARIYERGTLAAIPEHDLGYHGWLVLDVRDADQRRIVDRLLAPTAELVATQGEWQLFRSRFAPVSLLEVPPPAPRDVPTLGDRLARAMSPR